MKIEWKKFDYGDKKLTLSLDGELLWIAGIRQEYDPESSINIAESKFVALANFIADPDPHCLHYVDFEINNEYSDIYTYNEEYDFVTHYAIFELPNHPGLIDEDN